MAYRPLYDGINAEIEAADRARRLRTRTKNKKEDSTRTQTTATPTTTPTATTIPAADDAACDLPCDAAGKPPALGVGPTGPPSSSPADLTPDTAGPVMRHLYLHPDCRSVVMTLCEAWAPSTLPAWWCDLMKWHKPHARLTKLTEAAYRQVVRQVSRAWPTMNADDRAVVADRMEAIVEYAESVGWTQCHREMQEP